MIPLFASKVPTEVFSRVLSTDSTVWGGYTLVVVVPYTFLGGPANTVKLTMTGPSTSSTQITNMYVGHKGAGDSYDFASTPTQITVGGNGSFTIPQNGTLVSDDINFSYDGVTDLSIAMAFTNPSDIRGVFSGAGCSYFYKASVSDAATVNKSGYTPGGSNPNLCAVISKIEMDV